MTSYEEPMEEKLANKINYYALLLAIFSPTKKDKEGKDIVDKNGMKCYTINSAEAAFKALGYVKKQNPDSPDEDAE